MNRGQLINLVAAFLDDDIPIARSLGCPGLSCRQKGCSFYDMHLPVCQQIEAVDTNPFAGLWVQEKIKSAASLGVYGDDKPDGRLS